MVSAMMFSCDETALRVSCLYMPQTFLLAQCLDVSSLVLAPLPGLHRCASAGEARNAYACMMPILVELCKRRGNAVGHGGSSLQKGCPAVPRVFSTDAFPCSLCLHHST